MTKGLPLAAAAALTLLAGGLAAQTQTQPMHMHGAAAASGVAAEFAAANEKMHKAMSQPLSGDVDRDFVTSMIPHHQGAIDMAKILLAHSHDPELRRLAQSIVGAQEKEIAEMRAWLARHPG